VVIICTTYFNSALCPQRVFLGLVRFSQWTAIIFLNSVNQLIFVMVKCGVFFAVRTKFLILFSRASAFKGLIQNAYWSNTENNCFIYLNMQCACKQITHGNYVGRFQLNRHGNNKFSKYITQMKMSLARASATEGHPSAESEQKQQKARARVATGRVWVILGRKPWQTAKVLCSDTQ
jgi:hypothetical protein